MKKIFILICLLTFTAPVLADSETNIEAVKYMNQSQSFSGFNRSLPKTQSQQTFERPTQVKNTEKQYDYYGFEIEEPSSEPPVKKVIKTRSDNDGNVSQKNPEQTAPMTYDNFPKFYDNNNMMQNSMQGIMPGMMTPGMF